MSTLHGSTIYAQFATLYHGQDIYTRVLLHGTYILSHSVGSLFKGPPEQETLLLFLDPNLVYPSLSASIDRSLRHMSANHTFPRPNNIT